MLPFDLHECRLVLTLNDHIEGVLVHTEVRDDREERKREEGEGNEIIMKFITCTLYQIL
jgi:hypothetical protein